MSKATDIGLICASYSKCPQCEELFDNWIDAEPGEKIFHNTRDDVYAGICSCGAIIEFYPKELKKGDVTPHLTTERTLGSKVTQQDCVHAKCIPFEALEGWTVPVDGALKTGPFKGRFCLNCGLRMLLEKPRIVLPDQE